MKTNDQLGSPVTTPTEKVSSPDWALLPFVKADKFNPIIKPASDAFIDPIRNERVLWDDQDILNPAAVVKDGKVYLLYRARETHGSPIKTSRIGLAESDDGMNFRHYASPVLYPDNDAYKEFEWESGCEDPRVVEDDNGTYYMTYTAVQGYNARLFIATSPDLFTWTKYGSVFQSAADGKYAATWTKSGSIVSRYENGKIIATKINGCYWMYFGDSQIWVATSADLIHWTPVEMAPGETPPVELRRNAVQMPDLKIVLPTRKGMFDSDLVEPGPPAMLTERGILLVYNSRNDPAFGDPSLPEGTYTPSQALFDAADPTKLIARMDHYFMKPEKPYELTGDINAVCFVEGLANFKGKWLLYYGTADTDVAIAVRG